MQDRVARNEAAFRATLDARLSDIYAFFRRLRVDDATAQDLVQDTFLTAWQDLPDLRDERRLRGWVYRIAYRRYLRHRARAESPVTVEIPAALAAEARDEPGSDEHLERQVVDWALHQLPEAYLHPLVLLYWEGLSYPEAAQVLSLPLGTFAWRVHRGRRLLRQALAEGGTGHEAALHRPEEP